ncbi:MAG: tetratricopeptide repeat protein [Deltaproteobacteria bacterium]|nr:tetratricopeptide repeat protein [Deltaproteobacteria bacterium]
MRNSCCKNDSFIFCFLFLLVLILSGCAARPVDESPPFPPTLESDQSPPPAEAEKAEEFIEPTPRVLASLRLSEQASLYLESGRPDQAIRILEQAVNLDPQNGQSYYFLAEAWLMKGSVEQAREFNRLAGLYLENEDSWRERVKTQKERIGRTY